MHVSRKCLLVLVAIVSSMGAWLMVPTNPDHSLPLLPEIFSILFIATTFFVVNNIPCKTSKKVTTIPSILLFHHLFILTPRMLASIHASHRCQSTGSSLFQIQCFFQAGGLLNWSLRQYLYTSTALFVFLAAYYLSSRSQSIRKTLLHSQFFGFFFVVCAEIYARFQSLDSALPKWLGRPQFEKNMKFDTWFTNQGWLWPYLVPSLCLAVWLAFGNKRISSKLFGWGLLLALGLTLFINQQRGFYLIFLFAITIGLAYKIQATLRGHLDFRTKLVITSVSTSLLGVLLVLYFNFSKLESLFAFFHYVPSKIPGTISNERVIMWRESLNVIWSKIWFGHGYSSWYPTASEELLNGRFSYAFDTAHNWVIQNLFELGLLHTAILVAIFCLIATQSYRMCKKLEDGALIFFSAIILTAVTIMVQELDYIRPIFYMNALFWGTLAGKDNLPPLTKTIVRPIVLLVGAVCLISFYLFDRGLYSFEGNEKNAMRIERWSKQDFSMVIPKGMGQDFYTIFPVRPAGESAQFNFELNRMSIVNQAIKGEWTVVNLPNPKFGVMRYEIHNDKETILAGRQLSLRLSYPPFQSRLAILPTDKSVIFRIDSENISRICDGECEFKAESCQSPMKLGFRLKNSTSQEIFGIVKTSSGAKNISTQNLILPPGAMQEFQFTRHNLENGHWDVNLNFEGPVEIFDADCRG